MGVPIIECVEQRCDVVTADVMACLVRYFCKYLT